MKANRFIRTLCVGMLCVSLILGDWPPFACASSPAAPAPSEASTARPIIDVALSHDGRLWGVVVDGQNRPLAGALVILLDASGQEIRRPRRPTRPVRVCRAARRSVCRECRKCGSSLPSLDGRAAPPDAQPWVSIRASETIIRGQSSPAYQWISEHPWLFYTGLATAITVPLVIATSNDDKPPASP